MAATARALVATATAGAPVTFTILGPPATKKTSQRIVRNKRTGRMWVRPSERTDDWTASAVAQLRVAFAKWARGWVGGHGAVDVPVNVRALIYRARNAGDAVNFYQAIADALEAAGVVENDRLIVSWDGSRLLLDRKNPRVELTLDSPK